MRFALSLSQGSLRGPGRRQQKVLVRESDLGSLLIQARIARGWSQRELGERLGIHMQKVQQYEAGEYAGASVTRIGKS